MSRRLLSVFFFVTAACLVAAPNPAGQTVQVTGDVTQPVTLTADDLAKMPRASVRATIHGTEVVYQGVWLHEVLKRAGVPQGAKLHGKALAAYVLAQGQDGYQVLFSAPELDPSFVDNEILIADTGNEKPLPASDGPFRLITPKDKKAERSVRMLVRLEVVQVRK